MLQSRGEQWSTLHAFDTRSPALVRLPSQPLLSTINELLLSMYLPVRVPASNLCTLMSVLLIRLT